MIEFKSQQPDKKEIQNIVSEHQVKAVKKQVKEEPSNHSLKNVVFVPLDSNQFNKAIPQISELIHDRNRRLLTFRFRQLD